MSEEVKKEDMFHPADSNGDGVVTEEEHQMYLEFKRKELEDADARRDAMRMMTWFALAGMLLYPAAILITAMLGYEKAANIIGDILLLFQHLLLLTLVQMHTPIRKNKVS